ncbi:MAG: hypothetical protein Q8O89_00035 [Nanoarchaeota archaeon]|nr:hypothetical protein [Nanoarchaeota archaeon]
MSKELEVIMFGPGAVGSEFLRVFNERKPEGIRIAAVSDESAAVMLTGQKVDDNCVFSQIYEAQQERRLLKDQFEIGRRLVDPSSLKNLVGYDADKRYVVIDSTNAFTMLDMIYSACENGAGIVSLNKKPYAQGDFEKVNLLMQNALGGKVQIRGTVGANLGAPDTLIDILTKEDSHLVYIQGCMSGTLGYICGGLEQGRKFSRVVEEAVKKGYTEPCPWDDISGRDVLNKAMILSRLIASNAMLRYDSIEVKHESFIGKVMSVDVDTQKIANLRGDDFVEMTKGLDDGFAELIHACGDSNVLRYLAEVSYNEKDSKISINVSLQAVPKESDIGQLKGTDNIFLFGINGEKPKMYFPPGPGAGIETTALAIYEPLLKLREIL